MHRVALARADPACYLHYLVGDVMAQIVKLIRPIDDNLPMVPVWHWARKGEYDYVQIDSHGNIQTTERKPDHYVHHIYSRETFQLLRTHQVSVPHEKVEFDRDGRMFRYPLNENTCYMKDPTTDEWVQLDWIRHKDSRKCWDFKIGRNNRLYLLVKRNQGSKLYIYDLDRQSLTSSRPFGRNLIHRIVLPYTGTLKIIPHIEDNEDTVWMHCFVKTGMSPIWITIKVHPDGSWIESPNTRPNPAEYDYLTGITHKIESLFSRLTGLTGSPNYTEIIHIFLNGSVMIHNGLGKYWIYQ